MRKPGWKKIFLARLEETACIALAAQAAGISRRHVYRTRELDPKFAERWQEALDTSVDMLEAKAHEVGFVGVLEPVFHQGKTVGHIRKYSVDMMKFLLSAHRPEKFRQNHSVQHSGEIATSGRVEVVLVDEDDA